MNVAVLGEKLDKKFSVSIREDAKKFTRNLSDRAQRTFQNEIEPAFSKSSLPAFIEIMCHSIKFSSSTKTVAYGIKLVDNHVYLLSVDRTKFTIHAIIDLVRLRKSKKDSPCLVLRDTKDLPDGNICIDVHAFPKGTHEDDPTFCGVSLSWHGKFRDHFVPRVQLFDTNRAILGNSGNFELRRSYIEGTEEDCNSIFYANDNRSISGQ